MDGALPLFLQTPQQSSFHYRQWVRAVGPSLETPDVKDIPVEVKLLPGQLDRFRYPQCRNIIRSRQAFRSV